MSKSNSNLFHGTLGTTVSGMPQPLESYSERGISSPPHIQAMFPVLIGDDFLYKNDPGISSGTAVNHIGRHL